MADFDDKAKQKMTDAKEKMKDMTDKVDDQYHETHGRLDEKLRQQQRDTTE